jgi:hypothetical protein
VHPLGEQGVVPGESGLGQQGHGVELGKHGLQGFLEVQAKQIVVLQHTNPTQQPNIEGAFAGTGPDGMKEAAKGGGLRFQGGRSSEGFRPRAQLILGARERRPLPRMPAQTEVLANGPSQFHLGALSMVARHPSFKPLQ